MSKHKTEKPESFGHWLLQVFILAIIIFGLYLIVFRFFLANETISGPSMQPTFENNDRVIAVRHTKLSRGDIVIFKAPDELGALYIKRIIGVPGDSIKSKNDVMYINGKPIREPYLTQYKKKLSKGQLYTNNFSLEQLYHVKKVPKDCYFVMGDHRNVSKDSRMIGFINKKDIIGEVKLRYFPFNQVNWF
ncbi:signal peptidase I [Lactobacillus taiwanensis]|uniref:Signal peptidase I n=1 Tax=Lactobacillus taiwanensis TaxID=508451 RepID=A0A256LCL4_9LACO|nr:signal peptidase I [Lactobacillus taiwanensis]OYR87422.1 signal peptidase I [Lactobacillus taiwanensis]OYR90355.1 signal peptidase I [Lactobacillus taiwanensis]OYR91040.1 signal peptidase I [Lactobacillus taiwanensis]OYR94448.1 signal peptidase I [Lactobacillus taiwanensis]OYR94814.1 signal peptidase I [Lactobacillus taiwanensis]